MTTTTTKRLTIKQARTLCASFACTLRKTQYDEFRVNLKDADESSAYYTNDLQDAVDTARAMRQQIDDANARVQAILARIAAQQRADEATRIIDSAIEHLYATRTDDDTTSDAYALLDNAAHEVINAKVAAQQRDEQISAINVTINDTTYRVDNVDDVHALCAIARRDDSEITACDRETMTRLLRRRSALSA